MRYFLFFLVLILSAKNVCADFLKVSGVTKHRHEMSNPVEIEDLVRAEEDPNFTQYIKQREIQRKIEQIEEVRLEKKHQAETAAYNHAQEKYLKEQKKKIVVNEDMEQAKHIRVREAQEILQEQQQAKYAANLKKQKEKSNTERIARYQKLLSDKQDRMPASQPAADQ